MTIAQWRVSAANCTRASYDQPHRVYRVLHAQHDRFPLCGSKQLRLARLDPPLWASKDQSPPTPTHRTAQKQVWERKTRSKTWSIPPDMIIINHGRFVNEPSAYASVLRRKSAPKNNLAKSTRILPLTVMVHYSSNRSSHRHPYNSGRVLITS